MIADRAGRWLDPLMDLIKTVLVIVVVTTALKNAMDNYSDLWLSPW
jgi:hypothetical protein